MTSEGEESRSLGKRGSNDGGPLRHYKDLTFAHRGENHWKLGAEEKHFVKAISMYFLL